MQQNMWVVLYKRGIYNFFLMLILFSFIFFFGMIRLDLFCVCGYVVNEQVGFAWFGYQSELKAWFSGEDRDIEWERDYILFTDEELRFTWALNSSSHTSFAQNYIGLLIFSLWDLIGSWEMYIFIEKGKVWNFVTYLGLKSFFFFPLFVI